MSGAHAAQQPWTGEEGLEDLTAVRREPQRHGAGPVLAWTTLARLCGLRSEGVHARLGDEASEGPTTSLTARADRAELTRAGWLTARGELTPAGRELAQGLGAQPVVLGLHAWHRGELRRGWIVAGEHLAVAAYEEDAASAEDAAPGRVSVDVAPVNALPIVLAKWGGLAPTWNYDVAHEVSDVALVRDRVHDTSIAAPAGSDAELTQLWAQDWTLWGVRAPEADIDLEFLAIGEQGQYVVRERTDGATVLAPRPGSLLWGDLQLVLSALPGHGPAERDGDDW